MMPTRIALLPLLTAVLLLTGCFNSEREPIYVDSNEVDPIQAPPGLDGPQVRNIFTIPGYSLPELAAQGEQELPPEVQPSAEAERSRSQIRFGRTGLYLAVEDTADSVWRRLGFSLDRGGMSIRSADESQRRYVFRFSHEPIRPEKTGFSRLAFWSRPPVIDHSGIYIARVRPGDAGRTRVELLDQDGGVIDMERAEFVLARLRERLG